MLKRSYLLIPIDTLQRWIAHVNVDDELPIREMIHTSLDMAGFQCLQAEDAKQAHQMIVDQRPALILLDWMMPGGVSGVDLCRRLKRDDNLAEIPVIMLTARGEEDHKVQGLMQARTTT